MEKKYTIKPFKWKKRGRSKRAYFLHGSFCVHPEEGCFKDANKGKYAAWFSFVKDKDEGDKRGFNSIKEAIRWCEFEALKRILKELNEA